MKRSLGTATLEVSGAGSHLPVNRALGPQCGFASVASGSEMSWDDPRSKLELLEEAALRSSAV